MTVHVLVVDDQPLLRHSLRLIIDQADGVQTVGEAADGAEAVARVRELRPDVVLMDVRMPGMDGIEATMRITAESTARVLVLSMFELDDYVYGALRAGASGFLLKDVHPEQLVEAILRTHEGESLFAPRILTSLVSHFLERSTRGPSRALEALTPREQEVLVLVARGLSNAEIMMELHISMGTVKTYIGNLRAKLHARDRAQLVIAAYEGGAV